MCVYKRWIVCVFKYKCMGLFGYYFICLKGKWLVLFFWVVHGRRRHEKKYILVKKEGGGAEGEETQWVVQHKDANNEARAARNSEVGFKNERSYGFNPLNNTYGRRWHEKKIY
jgi:hypothetical protein